MNWVVQIRLLRHLKQHGDFKVLWACRVVWIPCVENNHWRMLLILYCALCWIVDVIKKRTWDKEFFFFFGVHNARQSSSPGMPAQLGCTLKQLIATAPCKGLQMYPLKFAYLFFLLLLQPPPSIHIPANRKWSRSEKVVQWDISQNTRLSAELCTDWQTSHWRQWKKRALYFLHS